MNSNDFDERIVRLNEVVKILSISSSAWWRGIKAGIYPQGLQIGERITGWRYSDIMKIIDNAKPVGAKK